MNDGLEASFVKRLADGPVIRVEGLRVSAGDGVTVLFGASGSGKTTVLRCLAGLDRPDEGSIQFAQESWFDAARGISLAPRQRQVGLVPQDYALFPHLTAEANVAYGLHALPAIERRARVEQALEWLGLRGLEHRLPHELSGGEQQRVALARAVVPRPRLLLLDEPLSALDAPTRLRLRLELRGFLRQLGLATILVTHDRLEAVALGDQLVVMHGGATVQQGPVAEVLGRPASLTVAGILAVETIQPGRVTGRADGLITVQVGDATLTAVDPELPPTVDEVFVCIRAEDVVLARASDAQTSARNRLAGVVCGVMLEGPMARITVDCGFPLAVVLTKQASEELNLRTGDAAMAWIKAPHIHLIPRANPVASA